MKICIIGSGNQGTGLAGYLCQQRDCEEIILMDIRQEAIDRTISLIKTLGIKCLCKKVHGHVVDPNDVDKVAEIANGCDLFFHAIGAKTNIPIMKAALKCKAHYLDLRTNPVMTETTPYEETIDAQMDLSDEFKAINKIAITSLGCSPGWTSMAGAKLLDRVDTVESVIIRSNDWMGCDDLIATVTPSVLYSLWMDDEPFAMVHGEKKAVDLLDSEEIYEFPQPAGKQTIYTMCSSPEVVMFPKLVDKEIPYIEAKMGITTNARDMKVMWLKALAKEAPKNKSTENLFTTLGNAFETDTDITRFYREGRVSDGSYMCSVEVIGEKNGVPASHTAYYGITMKESMKILPWIGHAVGSTTCGVTGTVAEMICRGEIKETGFVTAVELKDYLDIIQERMLERGDFVFAEKSLVGKGMF